MNYKCITNLVFIITYAYIIICSSGSPEIDGIDQGVAWPNTRYEVPSMLKPTAQQSFEWLVVI